MRFDENAHALFPDRFQVHFLFGGNPGRSCLPNLRLDDFWQLELRRPTHEQILKRCKLIIRKHKFQELALSNSMEALEYLQTRVFEIIDHSDAQQTKEVLSMCACASMRVCKNFVNHPDVCIKY